MNNKGNKWIGLSSVGLGILAVALFMGGRFYQTYADQNQLGASAASLAEEIQTENTSVSEPVVAVINGDLQDVSITLTDNGYQSFIVQRGVPVRLTVNASQSVLNSCNRRVVFPEFDSEMKLKSGTNVIEFTPNKSGTFDYSCWMGMIQSSVVVVDDLKTYNAADINLNNGIQAASPGITGSRVGNGNGCCAGNTK